MTMNFLSLYGTVLIGLLSFASILWGISLVRKDASIIDRFWGVFFALSAVIAAWQTEELHWREILLTTLISCWALRLFLYIQWRARRDQRQGHTEDYRYAAMRREHGPKKFWWYSLFSIFYLQALLALVIGAPIFWVSLAGNPVTFTFFDGLGILLWIIGITFEAGADFELAVFKANPANKGKLLTSGLWSTTRHPNYFGDSLLWWGYGCIALSVENGYLALFGPLAMTLLIIKVSGVALLEKGHYREKPGFEDYVSNTPSFVPSFTKIVSLILGRGNEHSRK